MKKNYKARLHNRLAHKFAMEIYKNNPQISCRELQDKLLDFGYHIDHTTCWRWLRAA